MKQDFCVGRLIDWLRVNFGADDWSHQSRPMQTSQALKKWGEKGRGAGEGRMNILRSVKNKTVMREKSYVMERWRGEGQMKIKSNEKKQEADAKHR